MAAARQSVNLYLPEFRRKRDWLTALRMVQATGLLVALVAVTGAWETVRLALAESRFAEVDAQRAAAAAVTEELRRSYGSQLPSDSLTEQNRQLEESLQEKRAIMEFMRSRQPGNTSGFSPYLADLARFHVQGLSLRSIRLSQDGAEVSLSGEVARAELVPMYLQALNRSESFRGLDFQALQIAETPTPATGAEGQQVFDFTVSTGN